MFAVKKPGLRYVSRGNPAAWDWTQATLTLDGTDQTLDLSSIIPVRAKIVQFHCMASNTVTGKHFTIRPYGNTNSINIIGLVTTVIGGAVYMDNGIECVAQKVTYKGTGGGAWTLNLVVRGWWL